MNRHWEAVANGYHYCEPDGTLLGQVNDHDGVWTCRVVRGKHLAIINASFRTPAEAQKAVEEACKVAA